MYGAIRGKYSRFTFAFFSQMLSGLSVFHLAARYSSDCLKVLLAFIRTHQYVREEVGYLIDGRDNQLMLAPLHIAGYNSDPNAVK